MRCRARLFLPLTLAAVVPASAIWMMPDETAPVARLLENAKEAAKKSPKDAYPVYLQARLHSLAFARAAKDAKVYRKHSGQPPFSFPSWESVQVGREKSLANRPQDILHLRQSLALYERAVKMDPNAKLYALGRAWMHEEAAPFAVSLKSLPWMRAGLLSKKALLEEALRSYRAIVRKYSAEDKQGHGFHGVPDHFVSQEAAERIVAILSEGGVSGAEKPEIARMTALIKELDEKPKAITPILLPLDGKASLTECVRFDTGTRFDLDGDGSKDAGSWITPNAGWLVFDPLGTGRITSGRQLFGTGTFWMFFPDGYRALASLDNDANGWLEDRELSGISVWRDVDSDGVSDRGEVRALAAWGIVAIRTKPSGSIGETLMAEDGVRFADGRFGPTYDWVSDRR